MIRRVLRIAGWSLVLGVFFVLSSVPSGVDPTRLTLLAVVLVVGYGLLPKWRP